MKALALCLFLALPALCYDIGYDMSLDQYKQTRSLINTFSFTQRLSQSVTMNVDAGFTADRSDDLHRFLESRSGRAWISWKPMEKIEISTSVARQIQMEDRFGSLILDQTDNTTTGDIRYSPTSWLNCNMSLGSHYLDYENVSGDSTITGHDEGGVHSATISFNKALMGILSTSLALGENRTLGRQNDTGNDELTARFNYDFPEGYDGGSVSFEAGAARMFTTYNDSSLSHRQQDWTHAVTFTLPRLLSSLSMQVSTGWQWNNRYWEDARDTTSYGDPRDRLERNRTLDSSIRWSVMDDLSVEFGLSRDIDRNDRKRTAFGVDSLFDVYDVSDDRAFDATVTYTPGEARITFQRGIELFTFDTYGTWEDEYGTYEDNSDRDELREVLTLNVEAPASERLTLTGSIQGQRLDTYYLRAEQSGNSKTSSIYSITPGYEYDLGRGWDVQHSVKLSADYTTFLFGESGAAGTDLLFRRIDSRFQLMSMTSDSTALGISHRLRLQDQGSYSDAVYEMSEKSINNTITLDTGFHVGTGIGITPSYTYEYSRRDFLASVAPPLVEHLHHVGLRTRMRIGEGTLSLQLRRTFYTDDRPSYWQAGVSFNYLF